VLAVPGEDADIAEEIASLTRTARSELDVRVALLGSTFTDVLRAVPEQRAAVVVPLITGPHPQTYAAIQNGVQEAGVKPDRIVVTDPLGPHPLLAEALHVRLADAGLARADRIRQFSIGAAVDGVIVAAVGGGEAAREADMTAVLLAARLAVPVVAAAVDGNPTVADAVGRLRESGAQRIAVAPYVIGPELDHEQLAKLAAEAGLGCGAPLGAHSSVVRLVSLRYEVAMEPFLSDGDEVQE
jgi:sirohydrochlorin ferrochelatase